MCTVSTKSNPRREEKKTQRALTVYAGGSRVAAAGEMDEHGTVLSRIYAPEMIQLALMCILTVKKGAHTKSPASLAAFISSITYEPRKLVVTEDGIYITKTLFIPFNIMSRETLADAQSILEIEQDRNIFVDADSKNNIVYSFSKRESSVLGIGSIVCGFFLAIKSLIAEKNETYLMALFDTVVSKIVFEQRVEFYKIVSQCFEHGYVSKNAATEDL